jgi:L-seryl-tRNA(Ser) seleniumtransferase
MKAVARDAQPQNLAGLPSVDRILGLAETRALVERYGREPVVNAIRDLLQSVRQGAPAPDWTGSAVSSALNLFLEKKSAPKLRRVINLTGTVLHTNLGRALLPDEAVKAAALAMTSACNLEYDLDSGGRGDRDDLVAGLIGELTGSEAATIVNNNAAAVLLALNTLARGKEVVISRGEQIEIGGAFRMPDIMARAGCRLREIGTTNRTHLKDYAEAIGPKTALILKAHTSNYAVSGFTAAVDEAKLGALAKEKGVPLMVDLGSGALVDMTRWGLPKEPTPRETLAHGASLVTFSGDKLLGGPQAGIIVGDKGIIEKIKRNPLKRALRVNKMTLAALEAVLMLYRDPDRLAERLPTLRLLARPQAEILVLAGRLLPEVERALSGRGVVSIEPCSSQIGSGALPVESLPSASLVVRPLKEGKGEGRFLAKVEQAFRGLPVPVIGRVTEGAFRLDLRCLEDEKEFVVQLPRLELA